MRIYHASMGLKTLKMYYKRFPGQKLNVLRSFGTRNNEDHHFRVTHRDKCNSLILDSGTFTKFNRKTECPKPITLPAVSTHDPIPVGRGEIPGCIPKERVEIPVTDVRQRGGWNHG